MKFLLEEFALLDGSAGLGLYPSRGESGEINHLLKTLEV